MSDNKSGQLFVGTAGWSIPKQYSTAFPESGAHLERYAACFRAAEINSSFHRPHRRQTYQKWAASVPEGFQFSVKLPKQITHVQHLQKIEELIDKFLDEVMALEVKLGPLLMQLPPKLAFEPDVAYNFFSTLRERFEGDVVCEPRHVSWFTPQAEQLLTKFRVARVAADPHIVPNAGEPGGWSELVYFRLHGSPRIYYSEYSSNYLDTLIAKLKHCIISSRACWCIFDNTLTGAATRNALEAWRAIGNS